MVWCCECTSINLTLNSFKTDKVTGVSFIKALDLPEGRISLLIIVSTSKSKSTAIKNSCKL
jgi:hypothetical protein